MTDDETDLIWRLRNPLWQHYENDPSQLARDATQTDMIDAADEIERLRTEIERAKDYVAKAIASYQRDPADNDFQRGYLAALEVVRAEAFS